MEILTLLQTLGLAKNEGRIYETLLREGALSVSDISAISGVHRRNVYDSMNRLLERGLVSENAGPRESAFQAVNPDKLAELIQEKAEALDASMPALKTLYQAKPRKHETYSYRGPEGIKNMMKDMLAAGDDVRTIGGKGHFTDPVIRDAAIRLAKRAKSKGFRFFLLLDHETRVARPEIVTLLGATCQFLPEGSSTPATVNVFGDHVVIISYEEGIRSSMTLTVIVNQAIADSFRVWFELLWKHGKP
jgi:sugar-specific transcriptional regulator TrmB